MGLLVSKAGLGADVYDVMNQAFRRVRGGIGMATVGANAVFAAVTGSSIASASVFTRISVPEMLRLDYNRRFAVGVVAGTSVLGMIIPPSAMLMIYAFVAEVSVGEMFIAGIIPGLLLAFAHIVAIAVTGRISPRAIGGRIEEMAAEDMLGWGDVFAKTAPIVLLIVIVLGGIYTGWLTPVEAEAAGSLTALVIALARRRMTGHITASIMFLITAASFYSRMLGYVDLPNELREFLDGNDQRRPYLVEGRLPRRTALRRRYACHPDCPDPLPGALDRIIELIGDGHAQCHTRNHNAGISGLLRP